MRRYHIDAFIQSRKLNPSRRATAERRVRALLTEIPPAFAAVLLPIIDKALRAQEEVIAVLDARQSSSEDAMHADGARGLDAKLDKVLSLLDQALEGFVDLFGGVHAEPARKLRGALFPEGVVAITRRPFVEQHEQLNLLLRKLRSPELTQAVATLQIDFWIERLSQLNDEYGAAVTRPERVDIETVRALDTQAWIAHVEVIAAVISVYPSNKPQDIEGRQLLLKPIVEQEEEAALLRARRRNGTPDGQPEGDEPEELDEDLDALEDEGTLEPDEPDVAISTSA